MSTSLEQLKKEAKARWGFIIGPKSSQRDQEKVLCELLEATYNARTQEVVEIVNDVDLSYAVNDGRTQDELRGGQFACCEIRSRIKALSPEVKDDSK